MLKQKKRIILTDYGLASSYDSCIELNKKLKGSLKTKILKHELRHTLGKYGLKDFKNDFKASDPHFFEALWFSLKNPEALINYMAFMYSYKQKVWTINSTALYPFVYFGAIFAVFFTFLFKVPLSNAILGWVSIYAIINLGLLAYTHFYVAIKRNKSPDNH